jgi:hypothetical protein
MNVEKSDLDHSPSYGGGSTGSPLPVLASLVVIVFGLRWFSEQLAPIALGFILTIAITPLYTWLRGRGLAVVGSTDRHPRSGLRDPARIGRIDRVERLRNDPPLWTRRVQRGPEQPSRRHRTVAPGSGRARGSGSRRGQQPRCLKCDRPPRKRVERRPGGGVCGRVDRPGDVLCRSDGPRFTRIIDTLARKQPYLNAGFDLYVTRTRSYLLVSTVFGAIVAVLDGLALWIMGIPLVGVWVVLSFVTNYIPNVGFVIGVIPPALVALIGYDVNRMIWVIVIYCALNFVIQSLIQPRIVGDSVGLSTSLTFLSLVFWSFVIGPLGSVLAIPLTLFAKALLVDINPRLQWIRPLLSLDEDQPISVIDEARLAREDPLQLTRDDPAASTNQGSPRAD